MKYSISWVQSAGKFTVIFALGQGYDIKESPASQLYYRPVVFRCSNAKFSMIKLQIRLRLSFNYQPVVVAFTHDIFLLIK